MKKFFTAAAVALALCAFDARAAGYQSEGVRVGPLADERPGGEASAPAPKKDEKKPAAAPAESKSGRAPERKTEDKTLPTATANNLAVVGTGQPSATSDAPSKPGPGAPVPVNTPPKSSEAAADAGKATRPAPTPNPATPANGVGVAGRTNANPNPAAAPAVPLTSVYRIGVGDVLDVRLLNEQNPRQSTLYTVLAGGVLDYPLLKDPLTVAGMTTDELAAQLVAEFRHRGTFARPQVRVGVREYASHAVLVSGLVNDPGTKILRREAIPLYVVVAEAQPKPEAGRAVIISHSTGKVVAVDLNDAAALNTLVQSGDVVNVTVRPPEFFYIGGEVNSPGQKGFHTGMTLTQAVLASGGITRAGEYRAKVSRAGADGRLVSAEYSLKDIEAGAVPDPVLQAGDRIEVSRRK